ncbi:MAG: DeoR/GlpR transcriptional regulator [Chloroflexi bacterium]|nr:DeoR/GlpR transcriptional regulator [Chloroflexota bacterium]
MLKEERQQMIIQELDRNGSVSVGELAGQFHVSRMTIRRDLLEIEQSNQLKRTHGGAVLPSKSPNYSEPPTIKRMELLKDEKIRIAKAVAASIGEKEVIFLGSGTTTLYVAKELYERDDITVLSNAITIINELSTNGKMPIIGIGGFLRREEQSMIGHFAERVIEELRVEKVIVGMRGVHPRYGLTSEDPQELMTDRKILGISDNVIIVADHTKIGYVSTSLTAPITAASTIVTTTNAQEDYVRAIREQGVEVIQV